MNEQKNFYTPDRVKNLYGEIIPAYQVAFADDTWYEVSKCVDENKKQRCVSGLSTLAIGSLCDTCRLCPSRPAYETNELVERFNAVASSRPTAWYVEQNGEGLTMAAVAWRATSSVIAEEKYCNVAEISDWLNRILGNNEIMWLDEVFANKALKQRGNLQNFGSFVKGLANKLDVNTVAYRTISPQMVGAARRDFGDNAQIFAGQRDRTKVSNIDIAGTVPDRRDFMLINIGLESER